MNTGIQRSGATPFGSATSTTPASQPKGEAKKDIMAIMAGHRIPYCATASAAYPEDFTRKLEKAKRMAGKGLRFIHFHAPCPPGHKIDSRDAIRVERLAVESRLFPLYEVVDGTEYRITVTPEKEVPVAECLKLQGRFKQMTEAQIERVQLEVERAWLRLQDLSQLA
jgi:pyruvate ferredoxin oxidoreductase beta subunit/2-oxoisovalerate ferredoxin oxidoreductase beta subunit